MGKIDFQLSNLRKAFPEDFTEEQIAKGQTLFLKELAYDAHKFYGGKMTTVPKAGVYGFNWFNVWYTPGVSKISTSIRDNNDSSFDLTNRGNFVAVVSDSTRVLGDGDVTPSGGLGVMEGKAFLMKYLGGIDAVALCVDSYNKKGEHDPDKIIDFVKMVQPSFGAVNLEDISQPNCFKVLDVLREECRIPVWHDDAQGTGCVTLAGLINALKVVGKEMSKVRITFFGAGASNTTIVRLIMAAGGNPENIVVLRFQGGAPQKTAKISRPTRDFTASGKYARKRIPRRINSIQDAMKGADVLIALSTPGPDVIKPAWVSSMAKRGRSFSACANPVPEIYPYAAKEAGGGSGRHRPRRLPQPGQQFTGFPRNS